MVKYHSQQGMHWSSGSSLAAVRLWLTLGNCQMPTQLLTHFPLPSRENGIEKVMGHRVLLPISVMGKKDSTLENLICCQLK